MNLYGRWESKRTTVDHEAAFPATLGRVREVWYLMPLINLIDALDAEDGAPGLAVQVVFDTPKAFLNDDF